MNLNTRSYKIVDTLVPARLVEDHDDCLDAALEMQAERLGVPACQGEAMWADDTRNEIAVRFFVSA